MANYVSHYRKEDDCYQTNRQHQINVAKLCRSYCQIPLLKNIAYITGLHHDDGKNTLDKWQPYFLKSIQEGRILGIEKVDHSTLGGLIVDTYVPGSLLSEMIQVAIFTHHGLADCVSMADGIPLIEKRKKKYADSEIEHVKKVCEDEIQNDWEALFSDARNDLNVLLKRIKALSQSKDGLCLYGNRNFYLGMCERLLFSVLADGDVRDTVDFMSGKKTDRGMNDDEVNVIWNKAIHNLDKKIKDIQSVQPKDSLLGMARKDISDKCELAAYSTSTRYRLAVPTGAGKTLSSLRFAFRRAFETKKRHIFYVAPFRSILEQNADEIREAIGNPEWVLEHHGDVILETQQENCLYECLIENWDEVPVIATTAVQFFNTLFKEKKRNIRRFHSLCNSIIIFDEVQALPVKVMELFNLAVNFLTEIGGAVVVLCTATQPLLEELPENRMLKTEIMADRLFAYESSFRRVEYFDVTENGTISFNIEMAAEFIRSKEGHEGQVLAIFNTKNAARDVFEKLRGQTEGKLFHLSTSMCAEHRRNTLKKIRDALLKGEKVICVSTQLIEAGVDLSFKCVIRSLAGLDNLIQAAGRCNRNGNSELGHVFLIQMEPDAENLTGLPDIQKAQDAMRKILRVYYENPQEIRGRLDSEDAVQAYYREYLMEKKMELRYPVSVEGVNTDLVDLFSVNREFAGNIKGIRLKQAFYTAGEKFSLIEDIEGIRVVVPYGDAGKILGSLADESSETIQKQLIRKLQRYTVTLTKNMLKKIGQDAIHKWSETILTLSERYYDEEIGVCTMPGDMKFLDF